MVSDEPTVVDSRTTVSKGKTIRMRLYKCSAILLKLRKRSKPPLTKTDSFTYKDQLPPFSKPVGAKCPLARARRIPAVSRPCYVAARRGCILLGQESLGDPLFIALVHGPMCRIVLRCY